MGLEADLAAAREAAGAAESRWKDLESRLAAAESEALRRGGELAAAAEAAGAKAATEVAEKAEEVLRLIGEAREAREEAARAAGEAEGLSDEVAAVRAELAEVSGELRAERAARLEEVGRSVFCCGHWYRYRWLCLSLSLFYCCLRRCGCQAERQSPVVAVEI